MKRVKVEKREKVIRYISEQVSSLGKEGDGIFIFLFLY